MKSRRLFTGLLAMAVMLTLGCGTVIYNYKSKLEKLRPNTRVGVLMVDFDASAGGGLSFLGGGGGGDNISYAASRNYVFNSLIDNNLIPVSLNMTGVWTSHYLWFKNTFEAKLKALAESENSSNVAISIPVDDMNFPKPPMFLEELRRHLEKKRIDYVILMDCGVSTSQDYIKSVVIRVRDDVVVASKYYEKNKFESSDLEDLYRMIDQTIREFMGGR